MLLKKCHRNHNHIIFGNGEVILPFKNIDRVSYSLNHIHIYWSENEKLEGPEILHTKKGNFPKPIYITTYESIFKIDNIVLTVFLYRSEYIAYTEIVFINGIYSKWELNNLVTRINTILETNVTKEMSL